MLTCAAGCGTPLHPAAAAGGFDRHPGCEPQPETVEYRWACVNGDAGGAARNPVHALRLSRAHDPHCKGMTT